MSKTDKTDPIWVKALRKDSREVKEYHDHTQKDENGFIICDITEVVGPDVFYWNRRGSCGYNVSYYGYHGGFFARPPHSKWYRREYYGRERAQWRMAKHDMLKLSFDDIEGYDVESNQHHHSALWEMY